jgi:hypothetical protein
MTCCTNGQRKHGRLLTRRSGVLCEEGKSILAEIILANGLAEKSGRDVALVRALSQQSKEQLFLARIRMGLVANCSVLSQRSHPPSNALQRFHPDGFGRILIIIDGQAGLPRLCPDLRIVQQLRLLGQRVEMVPLIFQKPD